MDPDVFCLQSRQLWSLGYGADVLPSKKLLGGIEGHGEAGDKEVGEGKTDEEVVVDAPQLPVEEHAGDHQQVGEALQLQLLLQLDPDQLHGPPREGLEWESKS